MLVRMLLRAAIVASLAATLALGCTKKEHDAPKPAPTVMSGAVPVTVDVDGFKPSAVTFKKGTPASLVFTRTTDDTCATEVVFPELGIKKSLPKDQPVTIDVPTDKPQTLAFQCGMGMYKSSVVVSPN